MFGSRQGPRCRWAVPAGWMPSGLALCSKPHGLSSQPYCGRVLSLPPAPLFSASSPCFPPSHVPSVEKTGPGRGPGGTATSHRTSWAASWLNFLAEEIGVLGGDGRDPTTERCLKPSPAQPDPRHPGGMWGHFQAPACSGNLPTHGEYQPRAPGKHRRELRAAFWRLLPSPPPPPACCQIPSAASRVTQAAELAGAVVFLPSNASSLLNPVQQGARGRPARKTAGLGVRGLRPGGPGSLGTPGWRAGPWGQGQGWSRGGAAPADGNYDFRKLECCLGNIKAHSSQGDTLGAGGRAPGLPQDGACAHASRPTVNTKDTETHVCTAHTSVHPHTCKRTAHTRAHRCMLHTHMCASTSAQRTHRCVRVCAHTHTHTHPAKPLTHQS